MEDNKNTLDELNKGATMGMDAINFLLDKVKSKKFKKVLEKQYAEYEVISNKANELYENYSDKKPHETSIVNKMMTWYGIEMRTMVDESDSKIAELLLQGTNMGIIEGRRLLNNKKVDSKINKLLDAFVKLQEEYVEVLKEYL